MLAGAAAAVVFVVVSTVAGALRPRYHPASMFVSELSLGPSGWVQRANFAVSGLLLVAFAASTVGTLAPAARRVAPVTVVLGVQGGCLALSGAFDTDPSAMFDQRSVHGLVHGLLGAVVFSCMPVACLLVSRRDHLAGGRSWARTSLGVGVALVALIVALKVSELPTSVLFPYRGLVQRLTLGSYLGWVLALSVSLARHHRRPHPRHRPSRLHHDG